MILKHMMGAILLLGLACPVAAQQVPDRDFRPMVGEASFAPGAGPVVCLDEAHHNFHTIEGRFNAFVELLRRDGYIVRGNLAPFTGAALAPCAILVISNALPNTEPWSTYPSPTPFAFTGEEVEAVRQWVHDGGRLLLIADHQPFAGAAANLAAAFGLEFLDGFAFEGFRDPATREPMGGPLRFGRDDETLLDHAVVRGRNQAEAVSHVLSFTGQAFRSSTEVQAILRLPAGAVSLQPKTAWAFTEDTPVREVGGWLQGAVLSQGKGRAAVFGEAAMFSAQLAGSERQPMGMNSPGAERNGQFILNLMRWLSAAP